jgi:putative ABC transport system ATP-binding protein
MLSRAARVDPIRPLERVCTKGPMTVSVTPTSVVLPPGPVVTPRRERDVSTTIPSPSTLTAAPPAARTVALTKVYGEGDTRVTALGGVTVDIQQGRFTAVMGPSGSGKSTFMHCLAGLDQPTSGEVWIGGTELSKLKDDALTTLRRDAVGFIFQAFNLVPTLTALENITLPLDIAGRKVDQEWLDQVVATVGLAERLDHKPSQLSGGQQQRVAAARALASKPQIVFADEPTGNLDSRAGAEILGFLRRSVNEHGQTIVMVTHDPSAASYSDRAIFLADGLVVDEMDEPSAERVLERMTRFDAAGRRS